MITRYMWSLKLTLEPDYLNVEQASLLVVESAEANQFEPSCDC